MAHPQNSPRGLFAKARIDIGSQQLTYNSTGLLFSGQIRLNGQKYIGSNTTGYALTSVATIPSTDGGNFKIAMIVSAAGTAALAVNTTGTTWKYLRTTGTLNST